MPRLGGQYAGVTILGMMFLVLVSTIIYLAHAKLTDPAILEAIKGGLTAVVVAICALVTTISSRNQKDDHE